MKAAFVYIEVDYFLGKTHRKNEDNMRHPASGLVFLLCNSL